MGSAGTFDGEELTSAIIDCIIKVHQVLGPGFLENVSRRALLLELKAHGTSSKSKEMG